MISILPVIFTFLVAAELGHARTIVIQKKIDPAQFMSRLKEAGFSTSVLECPPGRTRCTLHLSESEKRSPQGVIDSYVFVDVEAAKARERDAIKALVEKSKRAAITQEERDRILLWVAEQLLAK